MTFQYFNQLIKDQFALMCKEPVLFRSKVSGDELWDLYINSFDPGDDPIFRDPNSTSHTCNNDKNFIRRYGNIVAIVDGGFVTMFDKIPPYTKYSKSAEAMHLALVKAPIEDVFVETYDNLNQLLNYESTTKTQEQFKLGYEKTNKIYTQAEAEQYGVVTPGQVYTFYHFFVTLPNRFVDQSGKSVESIQGLHRDNKSVFKRGLDEISVDTLELVRDLIKQGSLLNGDSYLSKLETFITLAKEYKDVPSSRKDDWCWTKSHNLPFAKFRNELIGTLCVELTQGAEINEACKTWNKRADPANYMKATAPISSKQIAEAKKFVEENGYMESFDRRFAIIDDINVSEILHQNVTTDTVKTASVFDKVQPSTSTQHKRSQFDTIEEVTIEKFMKDILPTCTSVEAFLENRMSGNLVALTTANNPESKKAFKWSNNFGWTYHGNLAGKSMIKDAVQSKGGDVNGVLRFSIMWAEDNGDNSDLDAHCMLPTRSAIYFGNKTTPIGRLDVDITQPFTQMPKGAVENITFPMLKAMPNGQYLFMVNQYSGRNSKGFKAEIEFNGETYNYEYNRSVSGKINVATVTLKDGQFTIEHHLPETASSKKLWNLDTNQFHKVNLVSLSPNFWGDNNIGNKHYLFMLEGCKSDVALRSFHNEFLNSELLEHRKVMEVLGETTKLEPATKQLCGLGFNSTVKDDLILKLSGTHKRTIKIKF